jgi:hypothetical protein
VAATQVRVGRFHVPFQKAIDWVAAYTDGEVNANSDSPYAYPAYDRFDADHNVPAVLSDADLLAPGLLNVPVGIRSFYALQRLRGSLEGRLANIELAQPLGDLPDERIAELVGGMYAVLDDSEAKPWGVNATTLSKVLHRKRPSSIALHDRWVRACYLGPGAPVPRARVRSWATYMTLVSQAMAADLRSQPEQFARLQAASRAKPALTDLRLLDIVAWHVGQRARGS